MSMMNFVIFEVRESQGFQTHVNLLQCPHALMLPLSMETKVQLFSIPL